MDQITKALASRLLAADQVVHVFGNDLLWLILVYNPGGVFGVRLIPPIVLMAVALAASVGLGVYLYTNANFRLPMGLSLALIMGGAIGNLIDRVTIGKVVDFVSVDTPDFIMDRWPVFNVADSAVSVGVVALFLISIFEPRPHQQDNLTNGTHPEV